jgi:WD40 repeat protein
MGPALIVRDLEHGRDVLVEYPAAPVRSVAFSPDGKWLATADLDGRVQIRPAKGFQPVRMLFEAEAPVNVIAFRPDSQEVAVGRWDGAVTLAPTTVKGEAVCLRPPDGQAVYALGFSPDGKRLACGGKSDSIRVLALDPATTDRPETVEIRHGQQIVESLDFSRDGSSDQTLATGGWDGTIKLWNAATGKLQSTLNPHQGRKVLAVRFSPDGKCLASAEGDPDTKHTQALPCAVRLWSVAERKPLSRLEGHTQSVYALSFSPDGRTLASGGMDQSVRFWNVATGHPGDVLIPGLIAIPPAIGSLPSRLLPPTRPEAAAWHLPR